MKRRIRRGRDSLFRDISAAAVQIGSTDGLTQRLNDSALQEIGNTVSNSIVVQPAVEYHGSVGISVGYTIGTNLSHNDIGNCTYGPISVGWGWGAVSYAANNTIVGNNAHDYKTMLNDGGCIYTLSPQPGNLVAENWCHSQVRRRATGVPRCMRVCWHSLPLPLYLLRSCSL